jgi:uncharacterized protein (DUF2147 family)
MARRSFSRIKESGRSLKKAVFCQFGPVAAKPAWPKLIKFFCFFLFTKRSPFLLLLLALPAAAAPPSAPTGRWLTANHYAVIQITPCGANFCGQIVGIIVRHAGDPMPLDWLGRPQCGFVLLRTARQIGTAAETRWIGYVQDPRDGASYNAIIAVRPDGDLRLRGYLGLPLLGQTQRWTPFTGRTFADCRLPGNNPNG